MEIKKLIELCIRNHMVGIPCDCPFYDKESGGFLERCHFRYNYPDTWDCDEVKRRMGKLSISEPPRGIVQVFYSTLPFKKVSFDFWQPKWDWDRASGYLYCLNYSYDKCNWEGACMNCNQFALRDW